MRGVKARIRHALHASRGRLTRRTRAPKHQRQARASTGKLGGEADEGKKSRRARCPAKARSSRRCSLPWRASAAPALARRARGGSRRLGARVRTPRHGMRGQLRGARGGRGGCVRAPCCRRPLPRSPARRHRSLCRRRSSQPWTPMPPAERGDYKGSHAFPSNITRDAPPITREGPPSLLILQGSGCSCLLLLLAAALWPAALARHARGESESQLDGNSSAARGRGGGLGRPSPARDVCEEPPARGGSLITHRARRARGLDGKSSNPLRKNPPPTVPSPPKFRAPFSGYSQVPFTENFPRTSTLLFNLQRGVPAHKALKKGRGLRLRLGGRDQIEVRTAPCV